MGEQPTFAKQIKLYHERKQKSRSKSEESQLPSKSEGCNEGQGFRGNCDSQGKLGMCPSLAESLAVGFSRNHVSRETMYKNKLFFRQLAANTKPQANKSFLIQQFFKNVGEAWASSPHLRSKFDFAICFPCCNCIFKSCSIQIKLNHEKQDCKFRPGNGAIAACWQAKAGVEPPFAGCERPFSLGAMFHVKH